MSMSIFLYSCHPLECHCSSILEIFFVCNDIRCNKGESLVTFSAVVGNFAVVFDDYPVVASGGGIISCCLFSFFLLNVVNISFTLSFVLIAQYFASTADCSLVAYRNVVYCCHKLYSICELKICRGHI